MILAGGQGNINGTGNELNNSIQGNEGDNLLDGGLGEDILVGGAGSDTYRVNSINDVVIEEATDPGTDGVISTNDFNLSQNGLNVENLFLETGAGEISAIGNDGSNTLQGNESNNNLTGLDGDDTLDGGAGADTLIGGTGNDTYFVDDINDLIIEAEGESGGFDTVFISASNFDIGANAQNVENIVLVGTTPTTLNGDASDNTFTGNDGDNTLNGEGGNDTLDGQGGNDIINGGPGNDTLIGGDGADTLSGGLGDDRYIADENDTIQENPNEGIDSVSAESNFTLSDNVENLTLLGTGNFSGVGNTGDNTITGNSGDNTLDAGGGGIDTLIGLAGDDTYVIDNSDDVIVEAAGEGTDTVQSPVSFVLSNNLENLTLIGGNAIDGTGSDSINTIIGNGEDNILLGLGGNDVILGLGGSDRLDGGTGADTLTGNEGDDTYVVDENGDVVVENPGEGTADLIESSITYDLSASAPEVENLTLIGGSTINGTGTNQVNTLIGNEATNTLQGLDGDDVIRAGGGNDELDGGAGNDILAGEDGDDTYIVDVSTDSVIEEADEGIDQVQASDSFQLGSNVENLTLTGSAPINGTGNTLDNTIQGNSAANQIDGGAGIDTLIGGTGDDTYIVDDEGDEVQETISAGTDTVIASVDYELVEHVEHLTLVGTDNLNGTGNALDNTITGNDGDNRLDGQAGDDILIGGMGDDVFVVDSVADRVDETADATGIDRVESSVSYSLDTPTSGNVENLTLTGVANIDGTGNALSNTILGNGGDNVLDGGAGADDLSGGDGNDRYIVDDEGDRVSEAGASGVDEVESSVNVTLGEGIENLILVTGAGDISGTGNALQNTITGNEGNNILDGGAGDDVLEGGAGDDTYVIDTLADQIINETAGSGIETVQSSVTFTLAEHLENLTLTGTASIDGTGNAIANTIVGNDAANRLDGGAGDDALQGGDGADTYVIDSTGDTVIETNGGGTADQIETAIQLTVPLFDNVENVTLLGNANLNLTGNAIANTITGTSGDNQLFGLGGNDTIDGQGGNDRLDGGIGADTLIGGDGDDVYIVDNVGDSVDETGTGTDAVESSVSFVLSDTVENLTLTGTADIDATGTAFINTLIGNAGDNTLSGLAGNDIIEGNDGNDTLDGGLGADTLIGGDGDDIYIVDDLRDVVDETGTTGIDTVRSSVPFVLTPGDNIENLILVGTDDLDLTGNADNNTLTGNDGNNTLEGQGGDDVLSGLGGDDILDGGTGADTLIGGEGNDRYLVDSAGDTVTETDSGAIGGIDVVESEVDFTLGPNLENLVLNEGAIAVNGIGNDLDNLITGNSNDNVLQGGAGADTLVGNDGNDTLQGGIDNDTLEGGAGNDILDGGSGDDTFDGGTGDDTYIVDTLGDVITESTTGSTGGTDRVEAEVSFTLGANLEDLTLTGTENSDGTGNELNNIILGNSGNNVLTGNAGNDTLTGNGGSDTLDGGTGNDTLSGGTGDDRYIVDSLNDVVIETTAGVLGGTDQIESSVTIDLSADANVLNIENLTLTGTDNIDGTGNALNNTIIGNDGDNRLTGNAGDDRLTGGAGNDTLDGGLGNDVLAGGANDDTYIIDNATDVIIENTGEGTDVVESSVTFSLEETAVENLTLTGTANIDGTGNELNNTILGNAGANQIDGGTGADRLEGGDGDDVYIVDNAGDQVSETNSDPGTGGVDRVEATESVVLGDNVENLTLIGANNIDGTGNVLNNTIIGNSGNNTLSGDQGDDFLDGGLGDDIMTGGSGNDVFTVDSSNDQVIESAGGGTDEVRASVSYAIAENSEIETLILQAGAGDIDGTGNELTNTIVGNEGANRLDGGAGADDLTGGDGDDIYIVDDVGDRINEAGNGIDRVESSISYDLSLDPVVGNTIENLTLTGTDNLTATGNDLANTITGNAGNNLLDGGLNADRLIGGAGDDNYVVDNAGDRVVESLSGEAGGTDTVTASITFQIDENIENLILTGTASDGIGNAGDNNIQGTTGANLLVGNGGNDILLGNDGNDDLRGGTGDDVLDGGIGSDRLEGGADNDTYIVDDAGDTVIDSSGADDLVESSITFSLEGSTIERLTLTGTANIDGTGNNLDNTIIGNSGDNAIDGGTGADDMNGGAGNDQYTVDNVGDQVTEDLTNLNGGGTDTVNARVDFVLGANLDNLTLTGTNNITGTGNNLANVITGNSGDNILDGGLGADTLDGGEGNDTYLVDNAGDVVSETVTGETGGIDAVQSTVSFTLGANIEILTLLGSDDLDGTGNELDNTIQGNDGANILDGGLGADQLEGGGGNDTYIVDSSDDSIIETSGGGTDDTINATASFDLGLRGQQVENLVLQGTANINGLGNESDNLIIGNSGNNILSGGGGNDELRGGLGNDTYRDVDLSDTIVESSGEGIDTIETGLTFSLRDAQFEAIIENLVLTGTDDVDGTGNTLDNTIQGNGSANSLSGREGADVLNGLGGNDRLIGGIGTDTLSGGSGDDVLIGGDGADTLTGNSGSDQFTFASIDAVDTITDFEQLSDVIVLNSSVFTDLMPVGPNNTLDPSQFGTSIIVSGNNVSYDNGVSVVQFATISNSVVLNSTDFVVDQFA
ncbi:MAG: calcium-binding protein [Cyanobacteria bacterium J06633_2]